MLVPIVFIEYWKRLAPPNKQVGIAAPVVRALKLLTRRWVQQRLLALPGGPKLYILAGDNSCVGTASVLSGRP
jgi:hypothetical protein